LKKFVVNAENAALSESRVAPHTTLYLLVNPTLDGKNSK